MPLTCSVEGCERAKFARGFCTLHYNRWRTKGDPGPAAPMHVHRIDKTCTADGCDRRIEAHGLCVKHLRRKEKHGDTVTVRVIHDSDKRFHATLIKDPGGCWLWPGHASRGGYVRASFDGVRWLVHRWAYQRFVASIPDGLVVDHLCRVRNCVNPEHLEAVTHKENIRRSLPQRGPRTKT